MTHISVKKCRKPRKVEPTLADEAKRTIFDSTELDSAEREAVRKGEARGKREYEKEHPECGLAGKIQVSRRYQENYDKIFGKKRAPHGKRHGSKAGPVSAMQGAVYVA